MAGNLLIVHGGGPTAVINASLYGAIRQAQECPHVDRVLVAIGGTGGLLIPPVMGATAFVMADMIATPYLTIAQCAALPALLYVISLLWIVHLEADKLKIKNVAVDKSELLASIKKYCYLVLPIFSVVYFIDNMK